MSDLSYSEREHGERPRDHETIDMRVWRAIQAKIDTLVGNGSFGVNYPDRSCQDGATDPVGTDTKSFYAALHGEVPDLDSDEYRQPPTHVIMDVIEFCWKNVSEPIIIKYHSFYEHSHLDFNIEEGRINFCNWVNNIFRRNGLAYELRDSGKVERLVAPVISEIVASSFHTGDADLDNMLEMAKEKFLDPCAAVRREALPLLWGAWERLKTLFDDPRGDKKRGIISLLGLLGSVAGGLPHTVLEEEAKKLTNIGNKYFIRHTEINQKKVSDSNHVDYLFYRLFSFIYLVVKTKR